MWLSPREQVIDDVPKAEPDRPQAVRFECGGLVHIYKRSGRFWHCSAASVNGRQYRVTTKEEDLPKAKQFAEEWYVGLRGKARAGLLKKRGKTFREAAANLCPLFIVPSEAFLRILAWDFCLVALIVSPSFSTCFLVGVARLFTSRW
jgi:hypothetical protein